MGIMKKKEVSWFGVIVKTNKENTFRLIDIMFPPQICKNTFVETDDEKFSEWYYKTFIKNNNPFMVRLHGHTHPFFAATPSGTDVNQFKQIMEEVDDYYIQLIINNDMDTYCVYHDKESGKQFDMYVKFEFTEKLEKILDEVVTIPEEYVYSRVNLFNYYLAEGPIDETEYVWEGFDMFDEFE